MIDIEKFGNALQLILQHYIAANHSPVSKADVTALKYIASELKKETKLPTEFVVNQGKFIDSLINIDHKIERGKPQKTRSIFGLKLRSAKSYVKIANGFLQCCNDLLNIHGIEQLFNAEVQQSMMKNTRLDQVLQTKLSGKPVIIYEKLPDFSNNDDEIVYDLIPVFPQPPAENSTQTIAEQQLSRLHSLVKDVDAGTQPASFTSKTERLSIFELLIISQEQLQKHNISREKIITYLFPSEFYLLQSETQPDKALLFVQNEKGDGYPIRIYDQNGFDESGESIETHLEKIAEELGMDCCTPVSFEELQQRIQQMADYVKNPLTL